MAKLQKVVPPSDPVYVLELTKTELRHIVQALGHRDEDDAIKDGLDPKVEYELYKSLNYILAGRNDGAVN